MSERVDCVVIGAGIVGLAIGRALALAGREVVVLERNEGIGEETSSRNSEVIHAGLYYPRNSLKARLCVEGKQLLYAYCDAKHVPFARCGKLIVATDPSQFDRLASIAVSARNNGVADLVELSGMEAAEYEPEVRAAAGLWSPSTGIVDSHALMLALAGDLEAAGGIIATRCGVESIDIGADVVSLRTRSGPEENQLAASTVVNAAGLGAGPLAELCTGAPDYVAPPTFLAKGTYFTYAGASPFRALVYPLPAGGGLGIHATHDLAGKLRFGPDVEWIDEIDYSLDSGRRPMFADAIRHYWPGVDADALVPGYTGIRPKLSAPGEPAADFRLDLAAGGPKRQLLHLLGIESPGLTSALALAEEAHARIAAAAQGQSDSC